MMWIEPLLMLSCGWVGGVVSALVIRHAIDGRQPLDPALLPTLVAMPIAALPALPPAPQLSPYAPKKVFPKPSQRTDQLVRVWRAAKQDRSPTWVRNPHPQEKPALRTADVPLPLTPATALLPSIAWGQPHGGEGRTLTQEVRASAALSEHGAQAPRRRPLLIENERT